MEAKCSECNKIYQERKEELFCLIGEIPMICYECVKKYQPERSKREDVNYFGMKAEIKEDGIVVDPSQIIDDAVL